MRVAIREQLALLVLFAVLLALTIVSVPTWIYVNSHIAENLREGLALTASLKAARISADLDLIQTSCFTISSRVLIQNALSEFYERNATDWEAATNDIQSALSVGASTGLLQARLYSRSTTGGEPTRLRDRPCRGERTDRNGGRSNCHLRSCWTTWQATATTMSNDRPGSPSVFLSPLYIPSGLIWSRIS